MSAAVKSPGRMTVDQFLNWDPGGGGRWQLLDGEPRAMAPANRTHGALQGELGRLIGNHLRASASPCSVVVTPGVVPRILAAHNVRVPDLAVTCSGYQREESTLADPVLIVEILSLSDQADTWANVWAYTSIPSVREILILRSDAIAAELLRRGSDGLWPEHTVAITDGDLVLESISFRVPLREAYATTRLAAR
ncbi:MAG: Uma2 family endonuclease [Alphaproteobacteria bacterium]|nr:Uma2 family endonuclease [Alphaproteobacteria bacterium]